MSVLDLPHPPAFGEKASPLYGDFTYRPPTWGHDGTVVSAQSELQEFVKPNGEKDSDFQLRTRTLTVWGHTSCESAGACYDKPLAACDDSNRCTWEGCDPVTGCTHKAAPEGMACGGGKFCSGGQCK